MRRASMLGIASRKPHASMQEGQRGARLATQHLWVKDHVGAQKKLRKCATRPAEPESKTESIDL